MSLREDLAQPSLFKKKFCEFMHTINPDYVFDAPRFVIEELTEYVENAKARKHETDPALLLDDVVDCIWVCTQASTSHVFVDKVYKAINVNYSSLQKETIDESLSSQLARYAYFGDSITAPNWNWLHDEILMDIVRIVVLPAVIAGHDWRGAFNALVSENMSKLNIPTEMIPEVFRNDRLNKKDDSGVFYSWYLPADFSQFLS